MPSLASWVLWFLGQPDQSLDRIHEALTLARALSEPNGLAHALCFATVLHQLRREERMAQEHAEEGIALCREHGLAMYPALSIVIRGWSLFGQERWEVGIEQMREGLEALQSTGTEFIRPHFLGLLAEALGKTGQHQDGLGLLEEALSLTHRNSQRYYQAELYRIKGELLLMQSEERGTSFEADPTAVARVEGCFNDSIKIAQEQKAKSWELRAVTSMARLYRDQGKQDQARSLLAQIYERFTEGFDTIDLREARALLDELS